MERLYPHPTPLLFEAGFFILSRKEVLMMGAEKCSGKRKAVLLLGHGSKAKEANETLREVAREVEATGCYDAVLPAFLQLEKPDFQEGVDELVGRGFTDIAVMPYFLYMGLHVTKDLPNEMEESKARHKGLEIRLTRNIGFDKRLVDITIERIEESIGEGASPEGQHPIERESFNIIEKELGATTHRASELPVLKRVIHTTADFEYKEILKFSPGAIEAGCAALRAGRAIVTDVRMVEAGIMKYRLLSGTRVLCFSSDKDVEKTAKVEGITKTAASMRKAAPSMEGGVVAIGNAPTALNELLSLIRKGKARPALVIGVPVGFVGAEEAKAELMKSNVPFIASSGRKGGSTVAVAIVNALLIEAARLAFE